MRSSSARRIAASKQRRLEGKKRDTINLTWLDARDDVQELLDAAKRYSETGNAGHLPGRPGRDTG